MQKIVHLPYIMFLLPISIIFKALICLSCSFMLRIYIPSGRIGTARLIQEEEDQYVCHCRLRNP